MASAAAPVALGLRAQRGGAILAAVALKDGAPRLVRSGLLATCVEGDRRAAEPYHVAAGLDGTERGPRADDPEAVVAEGLERQRAAADDNLARLIETFETDGLRLRRAAVLKGRGLEYETLGQIFAYDSHIQGAEAQAVRRTVCAALAARDIAVVDVDEKSVMDVAANALGLSEDEVTAALAAFGASAGRPWRQDHKRAALAAWLVLAGASE